MFLFFKDTKWRLWAFPGGIAILSFIWFQVQIDVAINEWFGTFYDMIQKALATPNSVTITEYWASLGSFIGYAAMAIGLGLTSSFLTAHWLFRWRQSMVDWYHSVYDKASKIEGAAQRVQEDTIKFTRIMEGLGTSLVESILVLISFLPILIGLGAGGLNVLFFGEWKYGLVIAALIWSIGGTLLLVYAGKILGLVGIEYDLQKKEAAYRKMLVIYEDGVAVPKTLQNLFDDVRQIHFYSYLQYLYFNTVRLAYLQVNVLTAYIFLAPSIVAGAITLGVMQQIIRAFGRVEGSFQYLLKAWPTIIEFISVVKRLREFESQIKENT